MTQFGPLLTTHQVEEAIEQFIRTWIDYYLGLAERATGYPGGPGTIARPAQYYRRQIIAGGIPTRDKTPLVVLRTTGTSEAPTRHSPRTADGRGVPSYDIALDFGVAALCYGVDQENARENCSLYASALAVMILKRRSFDGALNNSLSIISWEGIRLDDLPPDDQQTRSIARVTFGLGVKDFLSTAGPLIEVPPPSETHPDPGDWPTVAETNVTVTKEGE